MLNTSLLVRLTCIDVTDSLADKLPSEEAMRTVKFSCIKAQPRTLTIGTVLKYSRGDLATIVSRITANTSLRDFKLLNCRDS